MMQRDARWWNPMRCGTTAGQVQVRVSVIQLELNRLLVILCSVFSEHAPTYSANLWLKMATKTASEGMLEFSGTWDDRWIWLWLPNAVAEIWWKVGWKNGKESHYLDLVYFPGYTGLPWGCAVGESKTENWQERAKHQSVCFFRVGNTCWWCMFPEHVSWAHSFLARSVIW